MRANPRWPAALLLLAACRLAAAAEFGPAELMQGFAAVPAAQARFTEVRRSDVLRAPLELKGTLYYQRPDRLERRVLSPYQQVTRIEGDRVTIENPARGEPRRHSLAALPTAQALVEGLRATLAGDLAALERHYHVTLAGGREAWTLSLAPRAPAVAGAISGIQLAGSAARLARMEIEETTGDRVTMIFSDQQP
jgi:outer membrane lipoprotein-sorting protein